MTDQPEADPAMPLLWDHENADSMALGEHYTTVIDHLTRYNVFAKSEVARVIALHASTIADLKAENEFKERSLALAGKTLMQLDPTVAALQERLDRVEPVVTAAKALSDEMTTHIRANFSPRIGDLCNALYTRLRALAALTDSAEVKNV